MNGHPRDEAKVSVHCRWPLIRGNLTLKCVGRGIDNVAVQGRWSLTTGSPKAGTTVETLDVSSVDQLAFSLQVPTALTNMRHSGTIHSQSGVIII